MYRWFRLKDCRGPAQYSVKVTLTRTEDSGQPGFLALDDTSGAQGRKALVWKLLMVLLLLLITTGVTFMLNDGNNSLNFQSMVTGKEGVM